MTIDHSQLFFAEVRDHSLASSSLCISLNRYINALYLQYKMLFNQMSYYRYLTIVLNGVFYHNTYFLRYFILRYVQ